MNDKISFTYHKLNKNGLNISEKDLNDIAKKYGVKEISVFGSALRDDFTPQSDLDLLIEFTDSQNISLFDIIDIQDFFSKLTNRNVDIVEPASLKNPYRKKAILSSKEVLYSADRKG